MARIRPGMESHADWQAISTHLKRLALSLTPNAAEADDLTQQTLAALLAKNPDRAAHAGYARKVLMRLWLDEQRSFRRRARRWFELMSRSRANPQRDALADAEQAQRIRSAIASLAPQQHAVLVLRLIEELDYEQIADLLGCSVQTVRANLHLARQRVRATLGEQA
jgi:RNA polymerase sigma factor (sigma-70 family)